MWISTFIVFSLVFYGHLYFFSFTQGVSSAPGWIKALKDIAILVFSMVVLWKFKKHMISRTAFFFVFIIAIQIFSGVLFASNKIQLLIDTKNMILGAICGYCLFLILKDSGEKFFFQVFVTFSVVMALQVFFSYVILFIQPSFELWDFANASGFIGNPNTFALMLNLGITATFALSDQKQIIFVPLAFLVMGAGILLSASLSGFLVLMTLFAVVVFMKISKKLLLRVFAMIPVLFLIAGTLYWSNPEVFGFFPHRQLYYKIKNTFIKQEVMPTPGGHESISFSGRREQYRDGLEIVKPVSNSIFGSMNDGQYRVYDGQYLQLAVNHGFPMLVFFIVISLILLKNTFVGRDHDLNRILFLWGFILISTQVFSHIWDYFPASLFLWFTYFAATDLKVVSPKTESIL